MEQSPHDTNPSGEKLNRNDGEPRNPSSTTKKDEGRHNQGISFRRLHCTGSSSSDRLQPTVNSYLQAIISYPLSLFRPRAQRKVQILQDFEGLIRPGEMLLVLGRPGSGCSTFLKAMAGETQGFEVSSETEIRYQGIPSEQMRKHFKGARVYLAELDVHFAELSLGQTLAFAASTRAGANDDGRVNDGVARTVAGQFHLADSFDTKVGNAMIRGLSGGEKRRTSIAEIFVGGAPFQFWDNCTRGLDSLTALRIVKLLRGLTSSSQSTVAMSLYQASQEIYSQFDNVILLYEGREIYFGPTDMAAEYFTSLGFVMPSNATTADFLTSLTLPEQRVVHPDHTDKVPRLPEEFANVWKSSPQARALRAEILDMQSSTDGVANNDGDNIVAARTKYPELGASTYPLSWAKEVLICTQRSFHRMRNESGAPIGAIIANGILGLVVGSAFYNLADTTDSFDSRAVVIFFALIVSSFVPAYEITIMWATRAVVQKHNTYAFYHPVSEAVASMVSEFLPKFGMSVCLHIPIYFLANLRPGAAAFFTHWFFMWTNLMTMSMLFRMVGSLSRTLEQSIPFTSVLSLLCVIYTGFVVPPDAMRPWLSWFWRINPLGYTYESLMINEFRDRRFPCPTTIPAGPSYSQLSPNETICTAIGSVPGENAVDGSTYVLLKYGYATSHLWRNIGILLGMMIAFCIVYLLVSEYVPPRPSRGEVLRFKRGTTDRNMLPKQDDEAGHVTPHSAQEMSDLAVKKESNSSKQPAEITTTSHGANFYWESVNYEIKAKGGPKAILTDNNGWVKPGTLTALMGVTGAGKTALLDTLADRVTTGEVSGHIFVDGRLRDDSFPRRMGYVQQEDIHLPTTTVREALEFSALLRQPRETPKKDKLAYVDYILDLMEMTSYAEAIVGVPGEGLNVEQRKRLTIAVEMAAKPDLLLFFTQYRWLPPIHLGHKLTPRNPPDEPTSGLDSQTAWSVCSLLRKLADSGQSILCTIHQPSAELFGMFDRLLLLNKGGTTLYFGDIGHKASVLIDYLESNGAPPCQPRDNPAEWILRVTGNVEEAGSSDAQQEPAAGVKQWSQVWQASPQKQAVLREIERLKESAPAPEATGGGYGKHYATPWIRQLIIVSHRIFTEQWRDPVYTYSKITLCISIGLLNGISFYNTSRDIQGLISLLFSNFLITQLFSSINQLIIPRFIGGRQLFEARERRCRAYTWPVFVAANLVVELTWQTIICVPVFASWYFPLGIYRQDGIVRHASAGIAFLLVWLFNLWANTLSQLFGVAIEHAEMVVQAATLCFWLSLVFCGVLVSPDALPRFWIFMYRVSPLTYMIEGLAASSLADAPITCSAKETLRISRAEGSSSSSPLATCGEYLEAFVQTAGGYVANPGGTSECEYCPIDNSNAVLRRFGMDTQRPWRDVGILAAYVGFNIVAMFGIYWLARVPRTRRNKV